MPIDFVEEVEEPKIDFMPEESAAPTQQSMGEFLAGVPQGVMSEAEKWKQAASEGMAPIGKALNVAGQNWKDLLGAYAFKLIGERGLAGEQLAQAAVRYLRPNAPQVPTPLEEGMRALPGSIRIPSEALYGTVETGPRLAAMAGLTAAGVPAPAAAAGAFGATPEGFSPKEAAIAAALPVVGHYTGKIAEVIAKELGVSTDAALALWNKVGGATGAAALLEGVNEAEISKLPKEQQGEARIQALGGILAQSILGMMGGREQGKPPIVNRGLTGEALKGRPEGAVPPPEGTIFLEEQPRIITGEEKVVQTPEQEIVEAQRLVQHGTPEEQALALERLKVLRTGQERKFTPVNPPIGAEKSTGALRTAEDLIAELKQPVFDDTLELGSGIPIQANERELNRQFRDLPVGTKVMLTGVKDDSPFNASVEVRLPNGNTANIPPEWLKSPTTAKRRTLPQLVKELGRNEVERMVGEWDDTAHLSEDGKSIVGFVDPRNQTGKSKLSTREFLDFLESDAAKALTKTPGLEGETLQLGAGIPLQNFPEPVLRELRDLRNARRGIAWRWQNRDPLETMAYTKGVAKNRAAIFAQQATHQVQNQLLRDVLGTTKPTLKQKAIKVGLPAVNPNARVEEALTFVREAGNDPAKLAADRNKIATAPDPALDPISLALWKGARDKSLDRIDFALANLPKLVPASQAYARTTLAQALQERAVGMETPLHRNYVMHAQDVEGDMDLGIFSAGGKSGESVRFKKARAFPDLASSIAAGYTPISMNAIDLLRARLNAGQRNINNRAWVDSLKTMTDVDGNPIAAPITVKHVPGPFPRDEQVVPKGYERVNFNGTDLAVLKGYSGLFRSLTEPSAFTRSPLGETVMAATHTGKHSLLLFDTFHLGRLSFWASIIQRKPTGYRKGLTLLDNTLPELHAMAARGEIPSSYLKDVVRNKHLIDDVALKTGYNVAGISDNLYSSLTEHIPITGAFNKFLFKEFQRGAMTEAWLYEFDRVSKQNPGKSEQEVGRMVSKNLNTRFGTLNEQSIIKNKTFTDLARLTFLAPQWNEGLITSELVGSGQLARVPFDLATKGRIVVGTLGRSIGTLALFHFAANQIINMVTRGYPTWKNPEEGLDAKLSAWVPDTTGSGSGYFISPIALPLETAHLLYKGLERSGTFADAARRYLTSRLSFLGRTAWTAGAKRDVFDRPIRSDRYWKEVGRTLIPLPISAGAAGRLGMELAGRGISQLQGTEYEGTRQQFPGQYQKQAMASMGIKSENAPNAIQRIARLAKDYNREKGVPENAEYSESDYNQLNQFLNVGNLVEAKDALNQLLKTKTLKAVAQHYRSSWKYPFTRNKERERGFFKSLSTEQQKAYTQAKEMKAKTSELAMRLLGKVQDEQARAQASPE